MDQQQPSSSKSRDFVCSCGKNYLSYAALFTHIKQKHNGKAPGPIVRPRSQRQRGRPRKNPLTPQSQGHEYSESDSKILDNSFVAYSQLNNQRKNQQSSGFQGFKPVGFQSYRAGKADLSLLRNLSLNHGISTKSGNPPENSQLESQHNLSLVRTKSAPIEQKQENETNQGEIKFVINHLKKLFEGASHVVNENTCDPIIDIIDWISHDIKNKNTEPEDSSHDESFSEKMGCLLKSFVTFLIDYLEPEQTKQISFMLSLFHEYVVSCSADNWPILVPDFMTNYLSKKVKQLGVEYLHIMKTQNIFGVFTALANWQHFQKFKLNGQKSLFKNFNLSEYNLLSPNEQSCLGKEIRKKSEQIKFQDVNFEKIEQSIQAQNIQKEQPVESPQNENQEKSESK